MNFLVRRLRGAMAATMVLMLLAGIFPPVLSAEAAVANTITFQGRLLASPTTPAASTTYQMRFSIWSDADFEEGVDRVAGALVGAAWSEVQTLATDSQGFFIAEVGSSTALPEFDSAVHLYLQAEVKANGAADSTYFLLDNMAFNSAVDRKSLINSAYAQNSKQLDGRSLGLGANQVPYLDANGKLDRTNLDVGTWHDPVASVAALSSIPGAADGSIAYVTAEDSLYMYDGTTWSKIGGDLSSQLATLTTTVANNTSSISTNASNIATNAAAIASNDTDIAANLAAIQSNDSDIAANLAAILSNDTDIAANTAAILSNDSDIADNAADIAANLAAIISNDSDIADNAADIAANLAAILANDTDIAANLAAILANDADIAANLAAIQSNDTDIATNAAAIAALDADTYSQSEVDNIVSSAIQGLSWKDPVANEAALTTAYPTPSTGDTAYVTGTGEIFTYNGSDWVKTGADFFQTATTSVEGIVQLATNGEIAAGKAVQANDSRLAQVATNTTNIATNAAAIASNDTDIAANLAAIQANDADIAANLAAIQANDSDIADNAADIAANLAAIQSNDTDIAANLAAIQSNDSDIAALQTAAGDADYTEENFVTDGESATDSIDALDIAVQDNVDGIDKLDAFVSQHFDVFLLP